MKSFRRHCQTPQHLEAIVLFEAHIAAQNATLPGLHPGNPPSPVHPINEPVDLIDDNGPEDLQERPPSPFSYLRALENADNTQANDSEDSDLEADIHKIAEAIWAMEQDGGAEEDEMVDDGALEAHARAVPESSEWYPFKRKEYFISITVPSHQINLAYMRH
ncbi:uncharacterized protein MELLADRAFT_91362 [Melampsora larici-populina 98AG31]|uniref:Uncharacterized protein n=1 Tax=Melampsora larici-populina (strain 98AG31 / pathotype 3-4-7) TaxID=747676 RepID=F4SEI1_MELLP|nr:uncharacterized protein MELLADRAFT_91362 [Melampsora larici-populina 98AG31]EGF96945.1 hypothetical protein MELLADRAFT_91362 [Melampsora larici-populina 98AG31]